MYCRYIIGGRVEYELAEVTEMSDDRLRAVLSNGREIDVVSGKEKRRGRYWMLFTSDEREISTKSLAAKARRWFKKFLYVDEIAVQLYRDCRKTTDIDTREYFHKLKPDTVEILAGNNMRFLKKYYRQPGWCCNERALDGPLGCRHLLLGKVKKISQCVRCRYFVLPEHKNFHILRIISGITKQYMNNIMSINDYDDIENGNRIPTPREMTIMCSVFAINKWTLNDTRAFFGTKDKFALKGIVADKIKYEIKPNQLQNEKKAIKF